MHGDVQNLTRKSDVKSKGEGGSPCSVLVGHKKTRVSSPFDFTHKNSTLLIQGFIFNRTFDITTFIELKDHFVRKKKKKFCGIKTIS